MTIETQQDPAMQKISDLIKDIPYAMLTSQESDGTLHSRPMHTEAMQKDGTLVFLTLASSAKAHEVEERARVSVTYMGKDADSCIAVAGWARLNRNPAQLKELWKPLYKAWFPKGLEDPDLTALEVTIERAEYWQTPSSLVVRVVGAAKALATGESVGKTMGEHAQIRR